MVTIFALSASVDVSAALSACWIALFTVLLAVLTVWIIDLGLFLALSSTGVRDFVEFHVVFANCACGGRACTLLT